MKSRHWEFGIGGSESRARSTVVPLFRIPNPRFQRPDDRSSRIPALQGFSLIELLVALAVFALVVVALLNLSGGSTRSALRIENGVLAGIVAENLASEAQLGAEAPPAAQGNERLGDRQWRWQRSLEPAGAGLVRVRIAVFADDGQQVAAAEVLR